MRRMWKTRRIFCVSGGLKHPGLRRNRHRKIEKSGWFRKFSAFCGKFPSKISQIFVFYYGGFDYRGSWFLIGILNPFSTMFGTHRLSISLINADLNIYKQPHTESPFFASI
ncbi:hypothetical protein AYI68_g4151 [Smittium mucronatum]|uniref:Uncharacterized protein n=1 Tax=Smittium mucronatum TaxID=133383 RepID=A0A1R0GXX0_9FUNG|nr:hypothetical protein AYI68_g4151 [Smittium mucronatum]